MKNHIVLVIIFIGNLAFSQTHEATDKKVIKLFEQAKVAYQANLYSKSLIILNEVLTLDSGFQDAYLMKSDIYQELDSVAPQIEAVEAALKINPDKHTKLYFVLGNAYYRSGLYQKAKDCYDVYLQRADVNAPFVIRARKSLEKCQGAVNLLKHAVPFNSINMGENINSEDDEYWPSITVDGKTIIFTRLVGSKVITGGDRRVMAQEDFYTTHFVEN